MTVDEIGVGPWVGDWPADERYDPELLAHGDRRNVVDRYRYWRREAVVADLDRRRHDSHVAIENWQHDFNIGTVVRDRKSTRLNSSHANISYAVFCLKKKIGLHNAHVLIRPLPIYSFY